MQWVADPGRSVVDVEYISAHIASITDGVQGAALSFWSQGAVILEEV